MPTSDENPGLPVDTDHQGMMTPPRPDGLRPCILCATPCKDTYKLRCRPCYDATQHILAINFAIYFNCIEAPGKYVVRRWQIEKDANGPQPYDAKEFDTLELARASLVPALSRIPRDPLDDPSLVETWI